ncbi:hypothetical protein V8C34DRAFT_217494 [Trichoderma compactum]
MGIVTTRGSAGGSTNKRYKFTTPGPKPTLGLVRVRPRIGMFPSVVVEIYVVKRVVVDRVGCGRRRLGLRALFGLGILFAAFGRRRQIMLRVVIVCTPVAILVPITATTSITPVTCSSALACITTTTTTLLPTAISFGVLATFLGWPLRGPVIVVVIGAAVVPSFVLIFLAFAANKAIFTSEVNCYIENRIVEEARSRSPALRRLSRVWRRLMRLGAWCISASKRIGVARFCDMIDRRGRCRSCMMSREPPRGQIGHD